VEEAKVQAVVRGLIADGLCDTAHDTSQGGLAVALAEMALAGSPAVSGLRVDLGAGASAAELLFGEAGARVVLALEEAAVAEALARCAAVGIPGKVIGTVDGGTFEVRAAGKTLTLGSEALRTAHEGTFAVALGVQGG
jgi:phosphoribosylformylglycinamidine synthase